MSATADVLTLPTRPRGRPSKTVDATYQADLRIWCEGLMEIASRLDFTPGTRGWCYLLEQEHGLSKGDFSKAEALISDARKRGLLPLNFCAEDGARTWSGFETLDETTVEEEAEDALERVHYAHNYWTPFSFWDEQPVFLMLLVEKIDLVSLFSGICGEFYIPRANAKGWADINQRAAMMIRFKRMEAAGKQCVLLHAGDFDPHGVRIAEHLRSNLHELAEHPNIRWSPERLIIDRFALTREFIDAHGLPWIDGLTSSAGNDLSLKPDRDVADYIRQHGIRKVEANALVVRPGAGRQLLRDTIAKYLPAAAPGRYQRALNVAREALRQEIARRLDLWGRQ